jgi:hypothetical protein
VGEEISFFHDYPGASIRLTGQNFISKNVLSQAALDQAVTGAFSPFGVPTKPRERIKGIVKASGSILRANPDGSQLELVAWGLRNPFRIKFDRRNRLFAANHGMDERGIRPIANSPDEFHRIRPGVWYGWPDYTGGYPITLPRFKPEGKPQPTFLLAEHPMLPPHPVATFAPHSAIMGFDFNYDPAFGPVGQVFIAEFGSEAPWDDRRKTSTTSRPSGVTDRCKDGESKKLRHQPFSICRFPDRRRRIGAANRCRLWPGWWTVCR